MYVHTLCIENWVTETVNTCANPQPPTTCWQWCENSVDFYTTNSLRTILMSHIMYTSMKNAYVINDVISTCRTRTCTPPDNESDVTWHHVIVHVRSTVKNTLTLHGRACIWLCGPDPRRRPAGRQVYRGVVTTCTGVTEGWASKRQCANSGSH